MYSQENEEQLILDYFGDTKGRFLDLGAYDGKTFSNTRALAEKGWKGTLVEASPQCFVQLQKLYAGQEGYSLVCCCLLPKRGLVHFWDCGGANASASQEHVDKWKAQTHFEPIYLSSVTVDDILLLKPGPYDFISLDIEGYSEDVAMTLAPRLKEFGVKMICVECENRPDTIREVMLQFGYKQVGQFGMGANRIFAV